MKIRANPPDPYSILNPETSSDSPSEKSKGVRFVSARQDTTQRRIIIGAKKIIEIYEEFSNIPSIEYLFR